jgi:hypothetical protein
MIDMKRTLIPFFKKDIVKTISGFILFFLYVFLLFQLTGYISKTQTDSGHVYKTPEILSALSILTAVPFSYYFWLLMRAKKVVRLPLLIITLFFIIITLFKSLTHSISITGKGITVINFRVEIQIPFNEIKEIGFLNDKNDDQTNSIKIQFLKKSNESVSFVLDQYFLKALPEILEIAKNKNIPVN